MLLQRLMTAAVLLPVCVAALFLLPSLYWRILLICVSLWAAWEWGRLAGYAGVVRVIYCVIIAGSGVAILAWENAAVPPRLFIYSPLGKAFYAAAASFWLGIVPAWLYYRREVRNPWLLAIAGWLVLIPFWQALVWLQSRPLQLFLALGVIWLADTGAYFVGRRFGRHRLAPEISPGKTWEGVWGAFATVTVYWIIAASVVQRQDIPLATGLACAWLMTILSITGDLFESWIKRTAGVKDSGGLLPGHGGLLDRIDSLCAALPLVALYFAYPLGLS